ncbi:hypothetical protein J6W78_05405 [bacterium]|nr:hypothetical protein [bacterium]
MSTVDFIEAGTRKNVSEIQALALTIMNAPATSAVSVKDLYTAAMQQTSAVFSNQTMPKIDESFPENANVISNFTGEDTCETDWFVKIVPTSEEAVANPDSAEEREELLDIIRRASYDLIQREMFIHSVYLTDNPDFNCRIDIAAPVQFPKLLLDAAIHYYPIDDKTSKNYAKSRKLDMPSIRIVCYPEWENEEWLYWKSKAHNETEDEPERLMMIYDTETNTAFLLGAKNFSEIRKAVKVLAWNTSVEAANGEFLPVNGTAKTISIKKTVNKKSDTSSTTFLTVSCCEDERSFFGLNVHASETPAKGEEISVTTSGDSGLLLIASTQNKKKFLVNFGRNGFGSIDSVIAGSKEAPQIISAENLALVKTAEDKKEFILNPMLSPNAKIHTQITQEDKDFPMPEYVVLMVNDGALPPVTMIKDTDLMTSMWFSYTTECDCCSDSEVIPSGNSDATWEVNKEIEIFNKIAKRGKFKLIVVNTAPYSDSTRDALADELILSVYTKIARNEITWKEWKALPGFNLPDKGTFKNIKKDFDTVYDTLKFSADPIYKDLLRDSLEMKIEYLRTIDAPQTLIAPFYKILAKLV